MASQSRVSWVRSRRTNSQPRATQVSRSGMLVVSTCPALSVTTVAPDAAAAKSWAPRAPPSSRAMRPDTHTTRQAISAGITRNPVRVSPNSVVSTLAITETSGGWSTYPRARCPPEARLYNSSTW